MTFVFDHIAIGCASLDDGAAWARTAFGVGLPVGGRHPRMGTHNLLTAVGPASFLELIAIDPEAAPPGRPRWFNLDAETAALAAGPRTLTWVVGTPNLEDSLAAARAAGFDLGRATEITRGDLAWLISVRDDGALPERGTLPVLIQWPSEIAHPATRMRDLGLRIDHLRLDHPDPTWLEAALGHLGVGAVVDLEIDRRPIAAVQAAVRRPDGAQVMV